MTAYRLAFPTYMECCDDEGRCFLTSFGSILGSSTLQAQCIEQDRLRQTIELLRSRGLLNEEPARADTTSSSFQEGDQDNG